MRRGIIILFIGFLMVVTGCNFNNEYINEKSEKGAAEKITTKLYDLVKNKQFKAAETLFSKQPKT